MKLACSVGEGVWPSDGRTSTVSSVVRAGADRAATNAPIQRTAADMIKLAMTRVDHALQKAGLCTRMLLKVHDDLLFELPPREVLEAKVLIDEAMKNALELTVPVEVETGTGQNWLEAH